MPATNVRPNHAALIYSVDLLKNKRVFWLLQIPAAIGFFFFGILFLWWTIWIRPGLIDTLSAGLVITLPGFFFLLLGFMIFIVLHELVHGLFFWIFTHSRPRFGFRGGYAYAAAPGWFFPRDQYLMIALAPFVLLSILGMALLAVIPAGALPAIFFGAVANACGAVGDMWITLLVIRERRKIVIEDLGDGFNLYAIEEPNGERKIL